MARDIMGEESWERNHGKRNHGRKLPRGSQEAPLKLPAGPQRLPGGSQEAAKATKAPRGP